MIFSFTLHLPPSTFISHAEVHMCNYAKGIGHISIKYSPTSGPFTLVKKSLKYYIFLLKCAGVLRNKLQSLRYLQIKV